VNPGRAGRGSGFAAHAERQRGMGILAVVCRDRAAETKASGETVCNYPPILVGVVAV
jgi:hypothetical protein